MEGKKKQKKKKKKEKNIMKKWNEKRKQREDALGVGGSRVSVRVQKRTYVRPGVKFWTYTKFLSTITPGVGLLSFSTIHNHDSIINTRILQFQGQTLRQRQQQNTNAPAYLIDFCPPASHARGSRFLRSAQRGFLVVKFARTAAMQNRAFSVASPKVWNDLPQRLRLLPSSLD